MKAYILVYEGFANFEISILSLLLKNKFEIVTFSLDESDVLSCEGLKFSSHVLLSEVQLNQEDILIIPGGNPEALYDFDEVYNLIKDAKKSNATIAAICAGPIHLARAGILENTKYTVSTEDVDNQYLDKANYIDQNVVIDGKIITAKGSGYAEFAVAVAKEMKILNSEEEIKGTIDFFINYIN
jgi:4-methyl-5(b-hydroxyethyl)-thiazole monophosphate biosynthesis